MDEPIDAVALGLKRGPRGAVGLMLIVVAIPIAVVAVGSGGDRVGPVPQVEPVLDDLAPLTPVPAKPKRAHGKKIAQPKPAPVAKREAASKPVVPEPEQKVAVAVVRESSPVVPENPVVEKEEELVPPPMPAAEPAGKLAEEEDVPERDGNGEAIARSIAASKRAAVRACFESELKQFPKLHGTVVVELDLAPPNRVNGVRVNDDLERAAFTSCVAATMRDVKFGALDEEITVSVPYVLTPAAK